MGLLSIFMTAIGLSMDAVAVSIAKGMTLKKNIFKNALKIAIFFGVFQGGMPLIGWFAGRYFEEYIKSFDHWIAFILLCAIGGKMIYESLKSNKERKEELLEISKEDNLSRVEEEVSLDNDGCDKDCEFKSEELSNKSLTILAIATSIDALAVGVSFAFLDVNIITAVLMIGLTTFALCIAAVLVGKKLGCIMQKYAEIVGGIILIIIGFSILIEHLF
ncbi:MAG: manganese efflux pump MntP family protein [Clostridium sp.]